MPRWRTPSSGSSAAAVAASADEVRARQVVGPTPEFFFVPSYAAGRLRAQPELGKAMLRDLRGVYAASREFVTARRASGAAAVLETWQRLVAGEASPREGFVLSL